jgi:hypothetical protein
MIKIDSAFDALIELHAARLATIDSEYYDHNKVMFAKAFRTAHIGIGRQCGKTWYIARTVKPNDVIVCYNTAVTNEMKERVNSYNRMITINVFQVNNLAPTDAVETVWIDDASLFSEDQLNQVYNMYASTATRFILIG